MIPSRIARAGDRGVLIAYDTISAPELRRVATSLHDLNGLTSCITGHSSILLLFEDVLATLPAELTKLTNRVATTGKELRPDTHLLNVSFADPHSPDLDTFLRNASMTRDTFLAELSRLELHARYIGFIAGFAYLEGLPQEWSLPRLATPRTSIPAGSFGVAAEMAAFYPVDCPGGWNLLGRTDAELWNPHRDPPNLISAGDIVIVKPTLEPSLGPPQVMDGLEVDDPLCRVINPGQRTLLVRAADPKRLASGLAPGGPFDEEAAGAANRAVGNPREATVLECTLVGPELRLLTDSVLSWYGADAALEVDGARVREPRQFAVREQGVLRVGRLSRGIRGWLAVEGGFIDPSPRFAPSPHQVRGGEGISVQLRKESSLARLASLQRQEAREIRVIPGPHEITPALLREVGSRVWTVTPAIDRVGIRLSAGLAVPDLPGNLRSCGMLFGTVQWHPSGELVLMGPDHPVTGGYLQPMTVIATDRWKLAQLAPGDRVQWVIQESAW